MSGVSCQSCGLVNFAEATNCRRCGTQLDPNAPAVRKKSVRRRRESVDPLGPEEPPKKKNRLLRSAVRVLALSGFIIFLWYASLIGTSDPVLFEQKQALDRSIDVLEQKGFSQQVFILRHLVRFRATDNWWNQK